MAKWNECQEVWWLAELSILVPKIFSCYTHGIHVAVQSSFTLKNYQMTSMVHWANQVIMWDKNDFLEWS
jgi:hypothetical protein